ncbi:EGF-like domain family protein [Acanthocheilonema viteae]
MLYYLILATFFILFDTTITFPQKNIRKDSKEMAKILIKMNDKESEEEKRKFGLIKTDEEVICEDEICNNRGTCIGSKDTNFCICKLGYTGVHCENSPCDSTTDCNGKGLCIGTSTSYTCMCQLGFTGEKCEHDIRK